jgi:hypothetical protein
MIILLQVGTPWWSRRRGSVALAGQEGEPLAQVAYGGRTLPSRRGLPCAHQEPPERHCSCQSECSRVVCTGLSWRTWEIHACCMRVVPLRRSKLNKVSLLSWANSRHCPRCYHHYHLHHHRLLRSNKPAYWWRVSKRQGDIWGRVPIAFYRRHTAGTTGPSWTSCCVVPALHTASPWWCW